MQEGPISYPVKLPCRSVHVAMDIPTQGRPRCDMVQEIRMSTLTTVALPRRTMQLSYAKSFRSDVALDPYLSRANSTCPLALF